MLDFTKMYWGHNLEIMRDDDGLWRGFYWATPAAKVGDQVIWPTNYGYIDAVIVEQEWVTTVTDMYKVTLKIEARRDFFGNEIDQDTFDRNSQ